MKRKTRSNRVAGIMPAGERDWEAEDDLRILQRAVEIKERPEAHGAGTEPGTQKVGRTGGDQRRGHR